MAQRVTDRDELLRILDDTPASPQEVTQDEVKEELDTFAAFMSATNA